MRGSGFTLTCVLTLALGIAVNVSVLAVINAYLWRSLPYAEASRLYSIIYSPPGERHPEGMEALEWGSLADVLEQPIAWDLDMFYLTGGDHAETAPGAWVTPGFMQGLGIQPALGRAFSTEDFRTNAPQMALISHALWQGHFGGDPAILGRRFQAYVSDRPEEAEVFTIIGVLAPDFWHFNSYTQVLAPLRAATYPYMAQLRKGIPPAEAAQRITALVRSGGISLPANWRVEVRSTHGEYVARIRPILNAVAIAAGLLLLTACANVAFLLLLRAARRQREIAVRLALGAGRRQIAQMLLGEAARLAGTAAALGLALSWLLTGALAPAVQRQLGRSAPGGDSAIALSPAVLALTAAGVLVTIALFALAPLLVTWRANLALAMHAGNRSSTDGRGARQARWALIGVEVAGSVALLAAGGLMLRTVVRMMQVDLGYRPERVLAASVGLRQGSYPAPAARMAFYERLLARFAEVPGVRAVGLTSWYPLQPPRPQPLNAASVNTAAGVHAVSPQYFAALGIPLLEGREFTAADRAGTAPVAIASATLAARLPARVITVGNERRAIVGVVRDVRQSYTDDDLADLYIPILQAPGRFASVYVRSGGAPLAWAAALRNALRQVDAEVALGTPRPFQAAVDELSARPKFLLSLLAGFSALAAALAVVGVYSVIAYAVRQREREIAVRMAVGASGRAVALLFLRQGAAVVAAGTVAGIAGAAALGKTLATQLYGVRPADPLSLATAATVFAAAALAAMWFPARRAARTDPALALREE
jgi:putative ABC transport system permease protein